MIKKLVMSAAVLAVLGFVFVPGVSSHASHLFHRAKDGIANNLPIEYELERAEEMIEEILPEIEACRRVVAEEQVEIRYLEREIARLENKQGLEEQRLRSRNTALKTDKVSFQVGGRNYRRATLEADQRRAFKSFKQGASLLESKRRLLEARRTSLDAARQRLDTVATEKTNLETTVEELRARLRAAQALEATTRRFELDDTSLARAKEIIARCGKRLDVAQQLIENEAGVPLAIPAMETEATDITLDVDRYFGAPRREAAHDADND